MFDHLAIDWGSKRLGLAVGDIGSGLVLPYNKCFIDTQIELILAQVLTDKPLIKTIVLGYPTNFNLDKTEVTKQVEKFATQVQQIIHQNKWAIQVKLFNERGTTKAYKSETNNKENINHLAAVKILQQYFHYTSK